MIKNWYMHTPWHGAMKIPAKRFRENSAKTKRDGQMDGWTDGQTDGGALRGGR